MLGLVIAVSGVVSLAVGAAIKVTLDRLDSYHRITRMEYIIGALIACLIVTPAVAFLGEKAVVSSKLTYNEYWTGWETAAIEDVTVCTRDGSCKRTYSCDPYTVTEWYTDSDGDRRSRTVTKWHECPIGTEEATYAIDTTLGRHVVARGHYTPNTRPWRAGRPLDGPTTPPKQWVDAKARLDADNPGPVTKVNTYDNYILASEHTILKAYSDAIDTYREADLLPTPVKGVYDGLHADKAYFVGNTPKNADAWNEAVARVGSALGTDKQGDLHVVLVDTRKVTDPDEYTNALVAYWQSPELGKNTASKNTVIVVAGTTDGKTVKWARAATGMPIGNEGLITAIRSNLPGTPWTPDDLIGTARAHVVDGDVTGANLHIGPGAISSALWALDGTGFERVCMTCKDEGGAGYDYLLAQVRPSGAQYFGIGVVAVVVSAVVWAFFFWFEHTDAFPVHRRSRY